MLIWFLNAYSEIMSLIDKIKLKILNKCILGDYPPIYKISIIFFFYIYIINMSDKGSYHSKIHMKGGNAS